MALSRLNLMGRNILVKMLGQDPGRPQYLASSGSLLERFNLLSNPVGLPTYTAVRTYIFMSPFCAYAPITTSLKHMLTCYVVNPFEFFSPELAMLFTSAESWLIIRRLTIYWGEFISWKLGLCSVVIIFEFTKVRNA